MKNFLSPFILRLKHFYKSNAFLVLISLFLMTIGFELFYRTTKKDAQLVLDFLYLEGSAFNEIYEPSNDLRIYRLKPNINTVITEINSKKDTATNNKLKVVTNNVGFRNSFDIEAKSDKYRIIILGGSNAFGFRVDNDGTYSYFMQKALEQKYPKKFEILNAGIPAYVMTQKIAYAEEILKKYNPDMLIIQTYNKGRSAFTMNHIPPASLFYNYKELFLENIPLLLFSNFITRKIHYPLIKHSSLYRIISARLNAVLLKHFPQRMLNRFKEEADKCADRHNEKAFEKFIEKHKEKKMPIILFDPTQLSKKDKLNKKDGYFDLRFANYSKPKSYISIHPKKNIYRWYAEKIILLLDDFLKEKIELQS